MAKASKTKVVTELDQKPDSSVLSRSLGLLSVLTEANKPMSLREIAEVVQLHDSTAHRLLQGLCDVGLVGRSDSRRYYAMGRAFLPLSVYHPLNALRRDSYESLIELRSLFDVTAGLMVFIGTDRMLVDLAGASGMLAPFYNTHQNNPLHTSAAGKVLLHTMSQKERDAALGPAPYARLTPFSKTTKQELNAELELTGKRGFGTNFDENFVGMSAIAAPLSPEPNQVVGALVLVGPTSRFQQSKIQKMASTVQDRARLISIGSPAVRAVRSLFTLQ